MMSEELAEMFARATEALRAQGAEVKFLERGGLTTFDLDLSQAALAGGVELKVQGYSLRMLRHGSNPGARLELRFGGNRTHDFFAPGQCVKGGFKSALVKRAAGSARVGKATFALLRDRQVDLTEDLIISALGPVDLLGAVDANGDPATWVTVPENTDPTAAYATQTGAFDGSGWELLRVYLKATGITTADVHLFHNPSWVGTTWFHATYDGKFSLEDSPTTGFANRVLMVPWSGRGVGCLAVYALLPGALTGVDFIVQGVK